MNENEHRGNPLPENLIRKVRRLRRAGSSIRQIARKVNLAKASVEKYAVGIFSPLEQSPPPRCEPEPEPVDEPLDDPIPTGDDDAEIDRLLDSYDL